MKKTGIILSALTGLMLLSFAPLQEDKAVRLKNGNYKLQNLKIEKDDVEKLQELADEMSQWFVENDDFGRERKGEKDAERKTYEDLMTIFESAEGFEVVAAFGNEEEHYILTEEIGTDLVSTILVYRTDDKEKDKKEEAFRGQIDGIMGKYLK